jgi:REP element-mobilizing transposase RayT
MSNHVHCILQSGTEKLSDTIRDLKGFTSKKIISLIAKSPESRKEWILEQFSCYANSHARNENYQLWTHENHARGIAAFNAGNE